MLATPDGAVWFTETNAVGTVPHVGRLILTGASSARLTDYALPVKQGSPAYMAIGPDAKLWVTISGNYTTIVRIAADGSATAMSSQPFADLHDLATGPDGNVWVVDGSRNFDQVSLEGKVLHRFSLISGMNQFVVGPDRNFWFTNANGEIAQMTLTGSIKEFSLPAPDSYPSAIAVGPDGNLWFTEMRAGKVARITTAGAITEYPLTPDQRGSAIIAGPDGNMWIPSTHGVTRITMTGTALHYTLNQTFQPAGITIGPNNTLYLSDFRAKVIYSFGSVCAG